MFWNRLQRKYRQATLGLFVVLPLCVGDRYNVKALRDEALYLEKVQPKKELRFDAQRSSSPRLPADLSLELFSEEQKDILVSQGEDIFPDEPRLRYAGCTHFACVINRIYAVDDDNIIGWQIYWFYQKTGLLLSTNSKAHFRSTNVDYSRFLFSAGELKAFWKIALLWDGYGHIPLNLKTFYRLQIGYQLNMGSQPLAGRYQSSTHVVKRGQSNRSVRDGNYIELCDTGLYLDRNFYKGNMLYRSSTDIYQTVSHEMAHAVDRGGFDQPGSRGSQSEDPAWHELSGWKKENGSWTHDPKAVFVTTYAATQPKEDFAETLSMLLAAPQLLPDGILPKVRFIVDHNFDGRMFDSDSLKSYYRKYFEEKTKSIAPQLVRECLNEGSASVEECYKKKIGDRLVLLRRVLKGTEWHACSLLESQEMKSFLETLYRRQTESLPAPHETPLTPVLTPTQTLPPTAEATPMSSPSPAQVVLPPPSPPSSPVAEDLSQTIFKRCLTARTLDEDTMLSQIKSYPYAYDEGYIELGFLDCLNAGLQEHSDSAKLLKSLDAQVKALARAEALTSEKKFQELKNLLESEMEESIRSTSELCKARVQREGLKFLAGRNYVRSSFDFKMRFQSIQKTRERLVEQICSK